MRAPTGLAFLALLTPALAQAGDSPAVEVIDQLLQEPVEFGFDETPLGQALDLIQEAVWLNVALDPAADAGKTMTLAPAKRTLGELVHAIEEAHGLEHRVWCDALYLHPRGAPPAPPPALEPEGALPGYTFRLQGEPLRDALNLVVELAGLELIVPPLAENLERAVHLRARNLSLRHALTLITHQGGLSWALEGEAIRLCRPLQVTPAAERPALEDRLDAVSLSLNLVEEPLAQLLDALAGAADVEIQAQGDLPQALFSLQVEQTTLRAALDRVCADAELTWRADHGVVVVSPATPR